MLPEWNPITTPILYQGSEVFHTERAVDLELDNEITHTQKHKLMNRRVYPERFISILSQETV